MLRRLRRKHINKNLYDQSIDSFLCPLNLKKKEETLPHWKKKPSRYEEFFISLPKSKRKLKITDITDKEYLSQENFLKTIQCMKKLLWNNEYETEDPLHPEIEYPLYDFFLKDEIRKLVFFSAYPNIETTTECAYQICEDALEYLEDGEPFRAILRYRIALDLFMNKTHDDGVVSTLISLGQCFMLIRKFIHAYNAFLMAKKIHNAFYLFDMIDFDRFMNQALDEIMNIEHNPDVPENIIDDKFLQGNTAFMNDGFLEAIYYYKNAIQIAEKANLWESVLIGLYNLGMINIRLRKKTESIKFLEKALYISDMIYDLKFRLKIIPQLSNI